MATDPERAADLLEDLVVNLHLMELEHTAFKFFVMPEIMAALQKRRIRLDKLLWRDVSWTEAQLREMIDQRVVVFTKGKWPSLDAVSTIDHLVDRMATEARGSPRNMLQLAAWLLYSHHQHAGETNQLVLTEEDFNQAVSSYLADLERPFEPDTFDEPEHVVTLTPAEAIERQSDLAMSNLSLYPPGRLRIEEDVIWRGDVRIGRPRSDKQYRLLKHLLINAGHVCSYDSLLEAVHGHDVQLKQNPPGEESINKAIQRLRQLIDEEPGGHRYFEKMLDHAGYRLVQP
jgi:hypothetical protein